MKESRKARRANVTGSRLFFSAEEIQGEGRILDLSATGCQATSDINLAVGLELQLSLMLPDHPWPVQVDQAIVRWVRGDIFGLEFLALRPSHLHRIRLLIINTR